MVREEDETVTSWGNKLWRWEISATGSGLKLYNSWVFKILN